MAYVNFSNKANMVVLNAFEAAAFLSEYLRLTHCEEEFANDEYDDLLMFGCQIGAICPLDDEVFKCWHVEAIGQIYHYAVDYLIDHPRGELYFVELDTAYKKALEMFDQNWRIFRTYTIYYELDH